MEESNFYRCFFKERKLKQNSWNCPVMFILFSYSSFRFKAPFGHLFMKKKKIILFFVLKSRNYRLRHWVEKYLSVMHFFGLLAAAATAAAMSCQSCLILCDPIDGSPPGSSVPGILQARTLEWVAISFSNAWKWKWKWRRSVVSDSYRPRGLQTIRLLCPWDSPGKSTGVGCHWSP